MMMMMIMIFMGKVEGNSNFEANGGDDVYKFHPKCFSSYNVLFFARSLQVKGHIMIWEQIAKVIDKTINQNISTEIKVPK